MTACANALPRNITGLVFTRSFYVLCRKLAGRFARVPRVRLLEPDHGDASSAIRRAAQADF